MGVRECYRLTLAGITIALETDRQLTVEPEFAPFLHEGTAPDVNAFFRQVESLPRIPERILHEDNCYRVHPDGKGGYLRSFFDAPRDMTAYAVAACDYENHQIHIDYLEKGAACVSQMQNSFFHLGLESILLQADRLCLHAACIRTHLGGILFSGRSGIGKSTQGELWCRHRGARLINGDRPILSKAEDGWLAWGSPYAGSSRCHINENVPVAAIVMLRQESSCTLRRLSPPEAFRAIWSGLTMNSWNEKLVERAADLTLELIGSVPVLEFGCTPDVNAVEFLEGELQKYGTKKYSADTSPQDADGLPVYEGHPNGHSPQRHL